MSQVPDIAVRPLGPADVLDVLDLYARAGMTDWSMDTLMVQAQFFPQGQWVAVRLDTDEVVGTAASAVVPWAPPAHGRHWQTPCPGGSMADHDPLHGEGLWGISLVTPTDAGWQDVVVVLDDARRALAERMGFQVVRTLVRLQGSGGTALNMSPERFGKTVNAGKVSEPVLRLLLKRGYQIEAAVTLEDGDQAVVLTWTNPQPPISWSVRHGPAFLQPDVDSVETLGTP
jgi:hypothetical protein